MQTHPSIRKEEVEPSGAFFVDGVGQAELPAKMPNTTNRAYFIDLIEH